MADQQPGLFTRLTRLFSTEGIDSFKFLEGWVEGIEPEQPSQDDEQV